MLRATSEVVTRLQWYFSKNLKYTAFVVKICADTANIFTFQRPCLYSNMYNMYNVQQHVYMF